MDPARSRACAAALLLLGACGDSTDTAPAPPTPAGACGAGQRLVGDRCVDAGVQDNGCAAGEYLATDGACTAAGVPPDACGLGFEPFDGGCVPILPSSACSDGTMAVPGETACRPVADCGASPWGEIPLDGTTQYVDQSYAGGDSDGSEAKPWTTIQEAVDAASTGGLVAVTDGSYLGPVVIEKPVRLWGRCPDRVELTSPTTGAAILLSGADASGCELVRLSVSGVSHGVLIHEASDVTVQQVRVHDTGGMGILAYSVLAPPSVRVDASLVERATVAGVQVTGGELDVSRSTVRATQPPDATTPGSGIVAIPRSDGQPSVLTLTDSVVESHVHNGVVLLGTVATIEGSVVRNNNVSASPLSCVAIGAAYDLESATDGSLTLRSSVIESNGNGGVLVMGVDGTLEHVSIRDTFGHADDPDSGRSVIVQKTPGAEQPGGTLDMIASIIERSDRMAVFDSGSSAQLTGVLVRGAGSRSRGLQAQPQGRPRSVLGATGCRVESSGELAVVDLGSSLTLDGTLVVATRPTENGNLGRGVVVQDDIVGGADLLADGTLRASVVDGSFEIGVHGLASHLLIEGSAVRQTFPRASDGLYGDNIWLGPGNTGSDYRIAASHIAEAARVGITIYDVSVALRATHLECNRVHLEIGESVAGGSAVDEGGNLCGCAAESGPCQAQTAQLTPPSPIEPD